MSSQPTTADTVVPWTQEYALPALAAGASLEMPASAHVEAGPSLGLLPPDTRVYLPHTSKTNVEETLAACRTITAAGLRAVPHLAARAVPSLTWLEEWLNRLGAAGTEELFLIAGDRARPAGPFADTLQLLDTGLLARNGFLHLGVAGHPEGHTVASEEAALAALRTKADYAADTGTRMWVVTQFVFDADPVLHWLRRTFDAGVDLPVWVGVPGAGRLRTLWRYAMRCGVGSSTRMLARRPDVALSLGGGWQPDELIGELSLQYASGAAGAMAGIHLFPFGGLGAGVAWLQRLRQGLSAGDTQAGLTPE